MAIDRDTVIEWIKKHVGMSVAAFCIFLIIMATMILKKQMVIGILGTVVIAALGIEERAKTFDKLVAVAVVFVLALGFMFFY